MARHNEIGKEGEKIAKKYLQEKGYACLEENWRVGKAEVDLIMKHDKSLVIVEVKTRSTKIFGSPEAFVSQQKEKILADAAQTYAAKIEHEWEIRFDIVAVTMGHTIEIEHFEDAFFPYF